MLEVSKLTVSYGQHQALENISIRIDKGEIVVILGAIERAAEFDVELVIVEGRPANAFAGYTHDERAVVGINLAMLKLIAEDPHAAAATRAHTPAIFDISAFPPTSPFHITLQLAPL